MSESLHGLIGTFTLLAFTDAWVYTLILFGGGAILALSEVFIPSGGILAGCSILVFLTASIFGFLWHPWIGLGVIVLAAVIVPTCIRLMLTVVPKMKMTRDLMLESEGEKVVVEAAGHPAETSASDGLTIGQRGAAARPLRPAGTVDFAGRRVDCTSIGGFIEKGAPVEIVEIAGPRVVVRRVD